MWGLGVGLVSISIFFYFNFGSLFGKIPGTVLGQVGIPTLLATGTSY